MWYLVKCFLKVQIDKINCFIVVRVICVYDLGKEITLRNKCSVDVILLHVITLRDKCSVVVRLLHVITLRD